MKVDIVTLFPEAVDAALSYSIIKRAREKDLLKLGFVNPRDFTKDAHRTVDDKPYGGGSGMLLMAEPVYQAINKIRKKGSYVILLTPRGRIFNQNIAKELIKKKHIILVCGHYEGIDERIRDYVDDEISLGDFILSGGESCAICIVDTITRLIKGVIREESHREESFEDFLLEFPQYTRPRLWRGKTVPDILFSGNHKKIKEWRMEQAIKITKERRPDLYKRYIENKSLSRRKDE